MELFLKGFSQVHISTTLGVSTRSIYNRVKAYKNFGGKGLKIDNRGRPNGIQLKPWQTAQIVKLVKNYCPDQLAMPFYKSKNMISLNE